MIIGHFRYDAAADIYTGEIETLSFARTHVVVKPVQKTSDREPDYRVVHETGTGSVEFGAAWLRRSDRGQDYLSVVLDDPSFGQALNVALFPDDRDDRATLIWNRTARKAPAPQPAEAAERPGTPRRRAPSARSAPR